MKALGYKTKSCKKKLEKETRRGWKIWESRREEAYGHE